MIGTNTMKYRIININDISKSDYEYYYSLMSPDKKSRIEKYKNNDDKKRSIAGEMLARIMLAEMCSINPKDIVYKLHENGKPYADNAKAEFNISHSGDYVICAVNDSPVGADIEQIRDLAVYPDKFFTDNEKDYIFNTNDDENETNKRFFKIWTFKEAIINLHGDALSNINDYDCSDYKGNKRVILAENYIATVVY